VDKIKRFILVIVLLGHTPVFSQINPGVGPRLFNHALSYGPRNYKSFYSIGYSFSPKNTIASIEVGYRPISVGMYILQDEPFVLNSKPIDYFYTVNYVYQNKKFRRLLLSGGIGPSLNGKYNGMVAKVGGDLRISEPLYISLHTFQVLESEMRNYSTLGLKLYFF
jgi:hypothetical protein